jgi:hypothetical protein
MGLRAAARSPELSVAKALFDLMGTVLGLLPILLAGWLLWRAVSGEPVLAGALYAVRALGRIGWPIAGALFTGAAISWAIAAGFWAGALPLVAADIEMNERPARGLFLRLAASGFPRVAGASAVTALLSWLVGLALFAALLLGLPLFFLSPTPALAASLAALFTCALGTGFFVELLGNLALVRAAVFGDGPATAFVRAARLLGERLGTALAIALAFVLLELVVATALGALAGPLLSDDLSFAGQLFALGPRIGLTIATTTMLAWLELARQGALAALAADTEGLLTLPPEPAPPPARAPLRRTNVQAWELRPPRVAVQPSTPERIPEAEPVIEALPVPEAQPDPTGAGPAGKGEGEPGSGGD